MSGSVPCARGGARNLRHHTTQSRWQPGLSIPMVLDLAGRGTGFSLPDRCIFENPPVSKLNFDAGRAMDAARELLQIKHFLSSPLRKFSCICGPHAATLTEVTIRGKKGSNRQIAAYRPDFGEDKPRSIRGDLHSYRLWQRKNGLKQDAVPSWSAGAAGTGGKTWTELNITYGFGTPPLTARQRLAKPSRG